ncbi:hypothetical protein [Roseibium sp.]|uniref:hypothetical protein n=1 Tax=Roseibium sp. TaxID=1936156 RepID=UPI00391A9195
MTVNKRQTAQGAENNTLPARPLSAAERNCDNCELSTSTFHQDYRYKYQPIFMFHEIDKKQSIWKQKASILCSLFSILTIAVSASFDGQQGQQSLPGSNTTATGRAV